jgi:DNA gyrase subunit A|tara:strand:+ start:2056 stop:5241 length:3186 start_codon:yes stop_codon:yes gene_type:complete
MMMRRRSSVVLQILSSKTMISTATPKPFEKIIRFGGPSSSLSLSSLSFSRRQREEEQHHRRVPPLYRRRKVRTFAASSSSSDDGGGGGGNKSSFVKEEEEEFSSDSNIVDLELHVEARQSYLAYAMSVIVGRALPDVRDGLKPVHRRILYAMHELNLDHNKPFKKCARVVGEVLGKFHPHGDQSVYDALVRMAQDFSMSAPLVNGHGNFGSMDNDPPAAMRYTECKLRQLSQDMLLKDVEMDCVEFADTFDGSQQEPMVLPAKLPNVLINGSTGIAVGMATSIPPHNLMEVADALVVFARAAQKGEQVKLEELLRVMPGPDFPTGGVIFADNKDANDNNNNDKNDSGRSTSNRNALRNLYRDGRGGVTLRGVAEIVPRTKVSSRKRSGKTAKKDDKAAAEKSLDRDIVISSIPYMQNKATLVQQIADLVNNRQIEGVADVRDESDRDGVRVVVEMKRSGDAEAVLNSLYKRTKLQVKVNVNVTALVGLTPKVLGLMEVMQEFLDFRIDVIRKRAMYSLEKDRARMHIVEALLTVLEDTDAVIKMIRKSKDGKEAMENLREMKGLTTVQSEAVLQMPLRRLTSLESGKLVEERDQLLSSIKGNQNLLDNTSAVIDVVCEEALEVKKKHGIPRRTTIETDTSSSIEVEHEIPNNDSLIIMSSRGYIKRTRPETFKAQRRGTRGKSMSKLKGSDSIAKVMHAKDLDRVFFFTDKGNVLTVRAFDIPEASTTAQGTPFTRFVDIDKGESITAILSLEPSALMKKKTPNEPQEGEDEDETFLVMITLNGVIKKVSAKEFSSIKRNGKRAIALDEGDKLKQVLVAKNGDSVLVGATDGTLIRFDVDSVRKLGRMSRGVRAISLKEIKSSSKGASKAKGVEEEDDDENDDDFIIQAEDDEDDEGDDNEEEEQEEENDILDFGNDDDEPLVAFVEHFEGGAAKVAGMAIIQKSEIDREGPWVVFVSEKGRGKRVKVSDFKTQIRGGAGIRGIKFNSGDSLAAFALIGKTDDDSIEEAIIVGSQLGVANRFQCASIPEMGRYAKGGTLMKLKKEDAIKSFAVIPAATTAE